MNRYILKHNVCDVEVMDTSVGKEGTAVACFPLSNHAGNNRLAYKEAREKCEMLNEEHETKKRLLKSLKRDIKIYKKNKHLNTYLELDKDGDIYLIDRKTKCVITSFTFPKTEQELNFIKLRCLYKKEFNDGEYNFNAKQTTKDLVKWTRDYLNSFGGNTKAVIGISGGKDSSVAAAVCVEAVGAERVIGVLMPNGEQHDIDKSKLLCKTLGIESHTINIKDIVKASEASILNEINKELTTVITTNLPARIRMTTLYNVAAMYGDSRVVNTCNYSEDYVGYATKFGDNAGDFGLLAELTVTEIKQIGRILKLPDVLVDKVPEDGLTGKTDEENFGFSYDTLDKYLRGVEIPEQKLVDRIERMHMMNLHKLNPMPTFGKE